MDESTVDRDRRQPPPSSVDGLPVSHSVVEESEGFTQSVAGVLVEAIRVGSGRGPTFVNTVVSSDFVATDSRIGIPMATHTTVGDDRLIMCTITRAEPGQSWCGIDLAPGMTLVYAPGAEHAGVDVPGLEFTFVATRLDRVEELADQLCLAPRLPDRGTVAALHRPSEARPVRRTFGALSAAMGTGDSLRSLLRNDALCAMVEAVADHAHSVEGGRGRQIDSRSVTRACLDYAESIGRIPSVSELCLAAHVSERRLRQAFADEFDMPPTRFFRAWALDVAHRRLRSSHADATSVSRVATDVGFTHLGRFSQHYRMLYGRTPSTTLRTRSTSARAG